MRILMISKALVNGAYQKKCEELAALPDVELIVAVPPAWHEPRVGVIRLERRFTAGYQLVTLPVMFNGRHHLHFYPTFERLVRRTRPDIVHVDEESFNLATFLALRAGVRHRARCCFYNYANIDRFYPPPFNLFERYAFRHAAHAFACSAEAATIMRRHGYTGPLTILPQFGVDPDLYAPARRDCRNATLVVGYIGRLVPEKGVIDLVEAVARAPSVRLRLIGNGVLRPAIETRIAALGIGERVELHPAVPSTSVPDELRRLDVLVLPSHTTRTWKEQFGRILVEAMSCAVPVIGSSSAAIPDVVGDAGIIYPEGDITALANALQRLADDPALRDDLGQRGRDRVLTHFTQAAIARQYYHAYRSMLN
ncbi:MAG: glycosyltransferase family 4 protein [Roseiflexus sp.]|jgi:glycosyltransferase involved in cell wall biosynthesis|nr:glycosyltransferase family 4 protein [Roseiflexus sp.]MBO9334174.1 glycosyltransferase family 4 protein [Roseiflexus sp.]MBO9381992.1 glycosyltransferase family 4 protein [Roseiflexus sp.]MBO9389406.1 glycosyltransferase family 4 protein [Roseiflexus sp.]